MQTAESTQQRYRLTCPQLPLAVYQEVVAHLRQVPGVTATLLPQRSPQFDYLQSQVGGLELIYTDQTDSTSRYRVDQILAYYGDRYHPWQLIS